MKKIKMCCLMLCLSLLAGCSGNGQARGTDGSVDGSIGGGDVHASASDDPVSGAVNNSQPNILDNPAYDPGDRQVVTVVVTVPFGETLNRIRDYNKTNSSYFIEVRDYGGGRGAAAAETLETQLTLEILSGKGPDLVIWDQSAYTPSLASERLMENLYDFMDADPGFHREDYYENIMEAFERNGGLYILPASFTVTTGWVRAEEMEPGRGVTESWELGEMIAAYENSSRAERFAANFTKELQIFNMGQSCMGNFIDWNSGECHFDTPEFVELLEFCNTFPEQFTDFNPVEFGQSGKVFWNGSRLTAPWGVAYNRVTSGDADLLWPGYPVADGEKELGGGMAEPLGECFSICKNSSNQEAAWDFIKTWLTEDMQREARGIPLLQSVSEERIQDALTLEYETVNGTEQEKIKFDTMIVITEGNVVTIKLSCITESDAETYRSIIESTRRSVGNNAGVLEIITEEAAVYFGGGKDAAAVADIIQNRASMYVSERMN